MIVKRPPVSATLRLAAVVVAGAFAFVRPTSAQVSKGLNEFGGMVKFEHIEGRSTLDTDIYLGRFVTNRVEVGAGWQMYRQPGSNDGTFNAFGAYHFGKSGATLVPYALARVGKHYGMDAGNPVQVAGGAGIKAFVGSGGALNVAGIFEHEFTDGTLESSSGFGLSFGASLFFR